MNEPLVSIIIPNYNMEKYIKEAIDSALNQTYKNIEVIVVDDGSTDKSSEIIRSFGKKIKAFFLPHKNANVARNFGMEKAQGKYIQFLDSDDLIKNEKIEKQVYILEKTNADIGLCYWESNFHLFHPIKNSYKELELLNWLLDGNWFPSFVPLYRKEFLKKIGFWNTELERGQDTEFCFRIALKKPNVVIIPEILGFYRFEKDKLKDILFLKKSVILNTKIFLKIIENLNSKYYKKKFAELIYRSARSLYDYDYFLFRKLSRISFLLANNIKPFKNKLFNMLFKFEPYHYERIAAIVRKNKVRFLK